MLLTNPSKPLRIGVGHRKGGTTKTTVVVFLALAAARRFALQDVHLIDADQTNDSTSAWARLAGVLWPKNLTIHRWDKATGERLVDFANRLVPADAHLFVDTGPHDQAALSDGMRLADVFVIPLRPSKMEVTSLFPTLHIAGTVHDESPFELRLLFSDSHPGTIVHREADEALAEMDLPRLATEVPHSVRYIEAFGTVPRNLRVFPDLLQELIEIGEAA